MPTSINKYLKTHLKLIQIQINPINKQKKKQNKIKTVLINKTILKFSKINKPNIIMVNNFDRYTNRYSRGNYSA
jgi:hypothetical protein